MGSLVMDGLLRRLVYDPNRTVGSLRDTYISSTPFCIRECVRDECRCTERRDVAEDGRDLALHHGVHDGRPRRVCDGGEGAEDDA